jgi:hypothetical protein
MLSRPRHRPVAVRGQFRLRNPSNLDCKRAPDTTGSQARVSRCGWAARRDVSSGGCC